MNYATWFAWGAGAGAGFALVFTAVRMVSEFLQGLLEGSKK
jgi:hypothetical protein